MTHRSANARLSDIRPDVLSEIVLMREDIQHNLQAWVNSPEHAHYVTTLCAAQDFPAEDVRHTWLACHDDHEVTQTLVMIDINSLPAEMRANLGATAEDIDTASCGSAG